MTRMLHVYSPGTKDRRQFNFTVALSGQERDLALQAVLIVISKHTAWNRARQLPVDALRFDYAFPNEEGPSLEGELSEEAAGLALNIFKTIIAATPEEAEHTKHLAASADPYGLRLRDDGYYAPVSQTAHLLQALQRHFNLPPLGFDWSDFTPSPAESEHGGGSVYVAPGKAPKHFTTRVWIAKQDAAWIQKHNRFLPSSTGEDSRTSIPS